MANRFMEIMKPHLERMVREGGEQIGIESGRALSEARSALIDQGWFKQDFKAEPQTFSSLYEQPAIEADPALNEGVWGNNNLSAEDLYGETSLGCEADAPDYSSDAGDSYTEHSDPGMEMGE